MSKKKKKECSSEEQRQTDPISLVSGRNRLERKILSQVPFDGPCGETTTQRGVKTESLDP